MLFKKYSNPLLYKYLLHAPFQNLRWSTLFPNNTCEILLRLGIFMELALLTCQEK